MAQNLPLLYVSINENLYQYKATNENPYQYKVFLGIWASFIPNCFMLDGGALMGIMKITET
ncbi:hypothetical protein I79_024832 [Cricetulus griseus]|uniref:Uncharacterized protein n=1 Tax=Cricetulus griseus TaxID=10029 RepID=G3ILR1_CRIGR|nr:hypothetical protein I79_024832 [Cricetulus griseus]